MDLFERRGGQIESRWTRKSKRHLLTVNARLRNRGSIWQRLLRNVLVIGLILVASAALARLGLRQIEWLVFSGNDDYRLTNRVVRCCVELREYVEAQLPKPGKDNLFETDLGYVREQIVRSPYVREATLRRKLPGTLEVTVVERIPMARLGERYEEERGLVVDEDGVVFDVRSRSRALVLPAITGYGEARLSPGARMVGRVPDALTLLRVCAQSQVGQTLRVSAVNVCRDRVEAHLVDGPVVSLAWNVDNADPAAQRADVERRLKVLRGILWKAANVGVSLQTVDLTHDHFEEYCPTTPRWDGKN